MRDRLTEEDSQCVLCVEGGLELPGGDVLHGDGAGPDPGQADQQQEDGHGGTVLPGLITACQVRRPGRTDRPAQISPGLAWQSLQANKYEGILYLVSK